MQQRYYDPIIGRFYSNDPVGFSASNPMMFNRYAYANNNPYKYVDPNGENPAIAISRSFSSGYSVGSRINSAITAGLGKPLGVAIYDVLHNESADNGDEDSTDDLDEIDDFNPDEDTMEDHHKTQDGKPRIKITKGDGSKIDITEDRVKRKEPAPNNPNGKGNDRIWKNSQPGTKGKKRDPLPLERQKIKELAQK